MYENGKVYAIICRKTGRRYVGSTCEPTLAKRLAQHVKDLKNWKIGRPYFSSFDILKDGDYYIVLLESYPCNSRDELRMCEQKHIDSCECINKINAYTNEVEYNKQYNKKYHNEHRDEINKRHTKYNKEHRDEINAKRRERVCCPNCQREMTIGSFYNHKKGCKNV